MRKKIYHWGVLTSNSHFWQKCLSIMNNNALSSENIHPLLSSHIKIHQQIWTNLDSFHLETVLPCIFQGDKMTCNRKQCSEAKIFWCIFILQTCSFSFHKTLIDSLESCELLWCFYQPFELSFWWHPFTAKDPLVSKLCNAKIL